MIGRGIREVIYEIEAKICGALAEGDYKKANNLAVQLIILRNEEVAK